MRGVPTDSPSTAKTGDPQGLTDEQLRPLDEAFPPGVAAGERYPEAGMAILER